MSDQIRIRTSEDIIHSLYGEAFLKACASVKRNPAVEDKMWDLGRFHYIASEFDAALDFAGTVMHICNYDSSINFRKPVKILDLGVGEGDWLALVKKILVAADPHRQYEFTGVEIHKPYIKSGMGKYPEINFVESDIWQLDDVFLSQYDFIYSYVPVRENSRALAEHIFANMSYGSHLLLNSFRLKFPTKSEVPNLSHQSVFAVYKKTVECRLLKFLRAFDVSQKPANDSVPFWAAKTTFENLPSELRTQRSATSLAEELLLTEDETRYLRNLVN